MIMSDIKTLAAVGPCELFLGDALSVLKTLSAGCVNTIVTSPPYFGLRDYGVAGQIGLEQSLQEYVVNIVNVFRACRNVLRDDGTLWVNLGDSYSCGRSGSRDPVRWPKQSRNDHATGRTKSKTGLPIKNLLMVPARIALALQADGWYLRQDIIWHKPNPMPESVKDRCVNAHEHIFLFSKSPHYYFNNAAMREPVQSKKGNSKTFRGGGAYTNNNAFNNSQIKPRTCCGNAPNETGTRLRHNVWTVSVAHTNFNHFATFPAKLIRPCILAGAPVGGVVLDPFMGIGTTALASMADHRKSIGIELNPAYFNIAHQRISAAVNQLKNKETPVCAQTAANT